MHGALPVAPLRIHARMCIRAHTCSAHFVLRPTFLCAVDDCRGLEQIQKAAQQQRVNQLRKLQQLQNQYEAQAQTAAQLAEKQARQDAKTMSHREHQARLAAWQAAETAAAQVTLPGQRPRWCKGLAVTGTSQIERRDNALWSCVKQRHVPTMHIHVEMHRPCIRRLGETRCRGLRSSGRRRCEQRPTHASLPPRRAPARSPASGMMPSRRTSGTRNRRRTTTR